MQLNTGPLVVVLVLVAAILHAVWKAIAHTAADRLVGFALIFPSAAFVLGGAGWWSPTDARRARPRAGRSFSAAIHVAYLAPAAGQL